MKKTSKILIYFVLVQFVLFCISCKKDENFKPVEDYLTSGKWQLSAATINPAYDFEGMGEKVTDFYNTLVTEECQRNSYMQFFKEGTCTYFELCYNDNLDSEWVLIKDQSKLLMFNTEYRLVSVTESELKMEQTFDEAGTTYTTSYIYKKI